MLRAFRNLAAMQWYRSRAHRRPAHSTSQLSSHRALTVIPPRKLRSAHSRLLSRLARCAVGRLQSQPAKKNQKELQIRLSSKPPPSATPSALRPLRLPLLPAAPATRANAKGTAL